MARMTADEIASMTDEQLADAGDKVLRWVEQNEATHPYAREIHALATRASADARTAVRGKLVATVRKLGSGMDASADGGPVGWRLDEAHTPAVYRHPKHPDPVSVAVFEAAFPPSSSGLVSRPSSGEGTPIVGGAAATGKGKASGGREVADS